MVNLKKEEEKRVLFHVHIYVGIVLILISLQVSNKTLMIKTMTEEKDKYLYSV